MSFLLPLVGCALLAADPEPPAAMRYLRADMGRYVLDGEVATTRADGGTVVTGRSGRPDDRLTFTQRFDGDGKLTVAEVVQEGTKKVVTLEVGDKGTGTLKRGGITDFLTKLPANPVVTAGPDWGGALALVRRYDTARGGKQEVAALWLDPVMGLTRETYTVERQAADTVAVKDREVKLDRYRVKLRDGEYAAWADGDGRVVRVQTLAAKGVPVVLEGYEDATKGLKP